MSQTNRSAIYQYIRDEHEALRHLLSHLHQALTGRTETPHHIAEMIGSLQKHLATHFVEEEQEGFFDGIVEQAPRLADRANQLREEHASLQQAAEELNRVATTEAGSTAWWQEVNERFHLLSRDLMHHEHKENDLLQDAYENDIGSKD